VPIDPHADDDDEPRDEGRRRKFHELECPECSAVTPLDDGFGDGDEVVCCYCSLGFRALVSGEGRLKLREI